MVWGLLCFLCCAWCHPNVLFIGVDDLRPDIAGPYHQNYVMTPNMVRLARWGTTFERSYCQIAICSPSRTSLLTGLRPDYSRVWTIGPYFRTTMGDAGAGVITLPQWFKMQGYNVTGAGKIFHAGTSSGGPSKDEGGGDGGYPFQANGSWSKPYFFCDQFYNGTLQSPAMQEWPQARAEQAGCIQSDKCVECLTKAGSLGGKPSWKGAPCDDNCYPDGAVADEVVKQIHDAKLSSKPFFIAAGFKRPHLGWFAPQQWFDKYNISDVPVAKHRRPPTNMPHVAFGNNGEMCGMDDIHCEKNDGYPMVPDHRHAELRRAYYSVVSFMDSQLGRVLDALESEDLRKNTIIVFWSDHGYQLGEHGLWCKVTNFELATRTAFIAAIPGQPRPGQISRTLVEHLDIYPTLVEAAGLPPPAGPGVQKLHGKSVLPLIMKGQDLPGFSNASYSQFYRPNNIMGLSIRTDKWRYTAWLPFDYKVGAPSTWNTTEVELYSHDGDDGYDFDAYENDNIAADPKNKDVVDELHRQLRETWDNGKVPEL